MIISRPRKFLFRAFLFWKCTWEWGVGDGLFVTLTNLSFLTSFFPSIIGRIGSFLFVLIPLLELTWSWMSLTKKLNKDDEVLATDEEDFLKLSNMVIPWQKELLVEQSLFEIGLGSVTALSKPLNWFPLFLFYWFFVKSFTQSFVEMKISMIDIKKAKAKKRDAAEGGAPRQERLLQRNPEYLLGVPPLLPRL